MSIASCGSQRSFQAHDVCPENAWPITRRPSQEDGRGRIVMLTPAGRDLIDRAFTDHMDNEHQLLEVLTPSEAASLEALLATWLRRVESLPSQEAL